MQLDWAASHHCLYAQLQPINCTLAHTNQDIMKYASDSERKWMAQMWDNKKCVPNAWHSVSFPLIGSIVKSKIATHILRELIENLRQLENFLISFYHGSSSQIKDGSKFKYASLGLFSKSPKDQLLTIDFCAE